MLVGDRALRLLIRCFCHSSWRPDRSGGGADVGVECSGSERQAEGREDGQGEHHGSDSADYHAETAGGKLEGAIAEEGC